MGLPPHLYREEARARGLDSHSIRRAIDVRRTVAESGAQPVLTLADLAQRCGVSSRYLRRIIERDRDPYEPISRPKRDGGTRQIASPEPLLCDVQRWILDNVLCGLEHHPASYAYRTGRSVVDCAEQHRGARWLIKLDLHDFFGSISEPQVFRLIQRLGYPDLLAFEIARLCTRTAFPWKVDRNHRPYRPSGPASLPQGAPTSGALANAAVLRLDRRLARIADREGFAYTRYSDDIVFSTAGDYSRGRAMGVVLAVDRVLSTNGLARHRSKTKIVPPGARKVVLGLMLDHGEVRLTARYKRRVETHIRGVDRFGLAEHAGFRNFNSIVSFVSHVDGKLGFAKPIEPVWAAARMSEWERVLGGAGYPVQLDAT